MKPGFNFFSTTTGIIATGLVFGVLAVLLQQMGNPGNMECIGGTGDLVTGLATAFLCGGAAMDEACTAAARMPFAAALPDTTNEGPDVAQTP